MNRVRSRGRQEGRRAISLLLEVLFGVGLFATAMLLIFGVFPTSQRSLAGAKNLMVANDLARMIMEQKKVQAETAATRADWQAVVDEGPIPVTVPVVVNGVASETTFNWDLAVVDVNDKTVSGNLDRKRLTVTISWQEGARFRSTVLETFVARADVP